MSTRPSVWLEQHGGPYLISGQYSGQYAEKPLGDVVDLSQFGVLMERLPPGLRLSHRYWHESEDEFVFLVLGELILIEDDETVLQSGTAAGWKAGQPVALCLENRSNADAIVLVVGTRSSEDVVRYPDHDMVLRRNKGSTAFTRLNGSPIVGNNRAE